MILKFFIINNIFPSYKLHKIKKTVKMRVTAISITVEVIMSFAPGFSCLPPSLSSFILSDISIFGVVSSPPPRLLIDFYITS